MYLQLSLFYILTDVNTFFKNYNKNHMVM